MQRRSFLRRSLAAAPVGILAEDLATAAAAAAEPAHRAIWRHFIAPHGLMIALADLEGSVSLPAPEECPAREDPLRQRAAAVERVIAHHTTPDSPAHSSSGWSPPGVS